MSNALNTVVQVESGVVCIGDSALRITDSNLWLTQIRSGKSVLFGTGGDGAFDIVVRITTESLTTFSEEGKVLAKLSTPLHLAINSGNVIVTDPAEVDAMSDVPVLKVEPGIYDCMVYLCDSEVREFFGYVIVLRKTVLASAENPQVQEIEQLG